MEHSEAAPRIELGALHPDIQDSREWERVSPRQISPEQRQRFQRYAAEIFEALGMPLDAPGTERTPERFIAAMLDATEGYEGDPKLVKAFPTECHGGPDCRISQVVEGPIPFHSLCEHHALPFYGHAYIGYIAHENIIGISKLTRLVRVFARRFSLQERIGHQVVETLDAMLQAHGVAVYLEAVHLCTQMRGVREVESRTRTSFWRGSYEEDPQLRAEFLSICGTRAA
jgi:GTP cyclohydrolase I